MSKHGSTNIRVTGFGYANTGNELLCKYSLASKSAIHCGGAKCTIMGKYVNDREVLCPTYPKDVMRYDSNNSPISVSECVIVEIAVRNKEWTNNE